MGEIPKLPPDPLVGKKMGRAFIERKLASGGMGDVYFGYYGQGKTEVAIKVLAPELVRDAVSVERFHLEAEMAQRINHPNVVRVMEAGQEGPHSFIIMEFIKGDPLDAIMRRDGKIDFERATKIIRDIARALEAAHGQKVIHRDIKPANVIIDLEGTVKLADFGIVRDADKSRGLTAPGMMVGTPEYMSPEQVSGAKLDHRSDLYSLGVTYYHLLTGAFPFEGKTDVEMAIARLKGPPKPVQQADPAVEKKAIAIIEKLMQADPTKRFASAREVAGALERALYGREEPKGVKGRPKLPTSKDAKLHVTMQSRPPVVLPTGWVNGLVTAALVVALACATFAVRVGGGTFAALAAEGETPAGLRMGLVAGSVLLAIAAVVVARKRLVDVPGWTAMALTLLGPVVIVVGACLVDRGSGAWSLLFSVPGRVVLGLGLLFVVMLDAWRRADEGMTPALRNSLMVAAAALVYLAGAGGRPLQPFRLLGSSAAVLGAPAGIGLLCLAGGMAILAPRERSDSSKILGMAIAMLGALGLFFWGAGAASDTAIAWVDIGGIWSGAAGRAASGFVSEGGLSTLGAAGMLMAMSLWMPARTY